MASEGKKIYVGGLADTCTKEDLQAHFGRVGKVAGVWIARNPAGFAFITFEEALDASEAVRVSDGEEFQGRAIRVELSRSDGRRGPRDGPRRAERRPERSLSNDRGRPQDDRRFDDYRRDDRDYRRDDRDYQRRDERDYRRDDYPRRDYFERDYRRSRSRSRGRY